MTEEELELLRVGNEIDSEILKDMTEEELELLLPKHYLLK